MRIRTILAAAAAPAIAAAALLATTGAASAAVQSPAPSAYFWQPNNHALTGTQRMPGGTVSLSGGYLAKVTADEHNADITGKTITIKGTLTGGSFKDQPNGGDQDGSNPTMRVYFEGGSTGTNAGSPDGYMSQSWWADLTPAMISLNGTTQFTLTITATPTDPALWSNWNGQQASANPDQFNAAASHVRDLGLSFGGGYFFENGVTGNGTLTISSITIGS